MSSLVPFATALALKGCALFLIGFAVARALRRTPAAAEHRAWLLMFAGALSLPLLMAALPGWQVLPSPVGDAVRGVVGVEAEGPSPPFPAGSLGRLAGVEAGPEPEPAGDRASPEGVAVPEAGEGRGGGLPAASLATILAAVWLSGSAVVFLWLAWGLVGLSRLRRDARRVRDPARLEELAVLARRAGVEPGRLRLLDSDAAPGPATWGWVRPVILLPAGVARAPAPVRRTVLLHELLHVRRRAWAVQLLAVWTCALYWFNPLAWLARSRLALAEEQAVDDEVVRAGIPRAEYAARLLEVVRALRPAPRERLFAVLFGRAPALEERLRRLLREEEGPGRPSRALAALLPLALVPGVVGLAALDGRRTLPETPGQPVAISPEPFLSVGVADGDPEEELHRVITPFLLPDGRLAVPLAGFGTIRVFAPDGAFMEGHGSPGEGPGEFTSLGAAWARGDTIEAFDGALRRITRFLPDGDVRVISLAGVPNAQGAVPGPLPEGWIVAGVAAARVGGRDEIAVHRVARDGTHMEELVRVPGMLRYAHEGGAGPHPLSPTALLAVAARGVLVAESLTPEIRVFEHAGRPPGSLTWDPGPQPSPRVALRLVLDSALARADPEQAAAIRRSFQEAPVPDRLSVLWGLLADPEGYAWVRPYDPARHAAALGGFGPASYLLGSPGPGGTWRILAPDGEEVGTVAAPEELELLRVTPDAVVGLHRDAFGVESVRVHRLERR